DEPLEVTGPVLADLWVSTDAPDTDFTAVFLDVHPDGSTWNVCEGAVRLRHALAAPPAPGAVHHVVVDLAATSIVLGAGHRLEVRVSSSSFPAWEPNPNTGRPLGADADADLRPARQQVFHDARHPSRVVLPVVPR
ncbi:MAG: CocE/NonD family hydrolase, partial [Acidimicrobiales bacterium]